MAFPNASPVVSWASIVRTLRSFADCLGIGCIVLLPFDEGLHVGGCDQLDRVTELADLAAPMMRAGAGLHRHEAGRLSSKEGQHLLPPQLLAEDRRTGSVRAVRLEDVRG